MSNKICIYINKMKFLTLPHTKQKSKRRGAKFCHDFIPFNKYGNAKCHRLLNIDLFKSVFWIGSHSNYSILQSLTSPVNFSWMLVGAIRISSFFSLWKLDYFSGIACLRNSLPDMITYLSTKLITSDFSLGY